jgi:hypothetical protein
LFFGSNPAIRRQGLSLRGARFDDMQSEQARQNSPTGKSLLIYGNRVKPQNKKISALQK